jgi:hypothetical protein
MLFAASEPRSASISLHSLRPRKTHTAAFMRLMVRAPPVTGATVQVRGSVETQPIQSGSEKFLAGAAGGWGPLNACGKAADQSNVFDVL